MFLHYQTDIINVFVHLNFCTHALLHSFRLTCSSALHFSSVETLEHLHRNRKRDEFRHKVITLYLTCRGASCFTQEGKEYLRLYYYIQNRGHRYRWNTRCCQHRACTGIIKLVFLPRSRSCNVAEWVTLGFDLFMCCEMPVLCVTPVAAIKNLFEILTFSFRGKFRKLAWIFHGFKSLNHEQKDGILKSELEKKKKKKH